MVVHIISLFVCLTSMWSLIYHFLFEILTNQFPIIRKLSFLTCNVFTKEENNYFLYIHFSWLMLFYGCRSSLWSVDARAELPFCSVPSSLFPNLYSHQFQISYNTKKVNISLDNSPIMMWNRIVVTIDIVQIYHIGQLFF